MNLAPGIVRMPTSVRLGGIRPETDRRRRATRGPAKPAEHAPVSVRVGKPPGPCGRNERGHRVRATTRSARDRQRAQAPAASSAGIAGAQCRCAVVALQAALAPIGNKPRAAGSIPPPRPASPLPNPRSHRRVLQIEYRHGVGLRIEDNLVQRHQSLVVEQQEKILQRLACSAGWM